MENRILNDFIINKTPTKILAQKYNLQQNKIKDLLKQRLGLEEYIRLSGSIGGYIISNKLKNKDYRIKFKQRLSNSIKNTLKKRMLNKDYYDKWVKKSKIGSIKGIERINNLLKNDKKFRDKWIKNCKKGGDYIYSNKIGIYDPLNVNKRKKGSLLGLKNTSRKLIGPNREKMYNKLEYDVAKILSLSKLKYEYEKIFNSNNPNGHISCDFVIEKDNKIILIEVTNWDKVKEKCYELNRKFKIFDKYYKDGIKIVVNINHIKKELYKKYLSKNILVFSIKEFKDFINKIED